MNNSDKIIYSGQATDVTSEHDVLANPDFHSKIKKEDIEVDEIGESKFIIREVDEIENDDIEISQLNLSGNENIHIIRPPQMSDLWSDINLIPSFLPLLKVLLWRSISLRYTQSVLGVIWIIIQPISSTIVIFFLFNLIGVHTADGPNQATFLFSGIIAWQFFARGLQEAAGSLLAHSGILSKIYIPKIMLPVTALLATWVDTIVVVIMLLLICILSGLAPTYNLFYLPFFLFLISFTSLSIGLGLAPINALFRDIGLILPLALQFVMYATPVYYSSRFVSEKYQFLYHLNPMVSMIEGVRWSILPDSPPPNALFLTINIITVFLILIISIVTYQKLESVMIDRI